MPQLAGTRDLEEPRTAPLGLVRAPLDQLALAHHPQHALLVHGPAQLPADPCGHEPVAVSRVRLSHLDDRHLDLVDRLTLRGVRWPPRFGNAVDSLAADPEDARHDRRSMPAGDELTGLGDALSHSHVRKPFPRISSS